MESRKLSLRTVILLAATGAGILIFITTMIFHRSMPEQTLQSPTTFERKGINPNIQADQVLPVKPLNSSRLKEPIEEDSPSMKEMKEQMEGDRLQQKKIKMLKLQLEQTNLQLEQEKARSQISKLEKENTSIVHDANDQGQDKYPEVKVIYIGGTANVKEAILAINGNNYSVKAMNKPVKNVEVVAITDTGVTLHFNLPQDLRTTIEYKPE
jgi:hypothetical protein